MHILGIIILYAPDNKNVLNNISKFINNIDHLIIWQNSDCEGIENLLNEYSDKLSFMGDKTNRGIAHPLNIAAEIIKTHTLYTHLLTMDQDSEWQNFELFVRTVALRNDTSIYSPNINNEHTVYKEDLMKVQDCITSGTMFSKDALALIKEFNEAYSVDCVDYDFSFKAIDSGIDIYKIPDTHMLQMYGVPKKSKFFGIRSNVYSAERSYFIVRNHILLWKDYAHHLNFRFRLNILKHYIFVRIIKIIIMEDNKIKKITSIFKGLFDGITNDRSKKYI